MIRDVEYGDLDTICELGSQYLQDRKEIIMIISIFVEEEQQNQFIFV